MSAIRARTLDDRFDLIFGVHSRSGVENVVSLEEAVGAYENARLLAPRLVLAWHHIRMGLRVLTSGKALP